MTHIYHHFDADGYASAMVVLAYLAKQKLDNETEVTLHVTEHSHPFVDIYKIKKDEVVYIVDYSPTRMDNIDDLKNLYENVTKEIVWIDHHASDVNLMMQHPFLKEIAANGLIYNGKHAGCMLTWMHLFNNFTSLNVSGISEAVDNAKKLGRIPQCISLVSDYDTWTMELENSKAFVKGATHKGLRNVFFGNPEESLLRHIINFDREKEAEIVSECIEVGKLILDIDNARYKRIIRSRSFVADLDIKMDEMPFSTRILVVNSDGNSDVFGDHFENYAACCIFTFNGESFTYSLYSRKLMGLDCEMIASYFKNIFGITGGGHFHAAGWTSPVLVFRKDCVHKMEETMYSITNGKDLDRIHECYVKGRILD